MGVIPIELQGLENWLGCIIGLALGLVVLGDAQEYFVHLFETLSQRTKINYDPNPLHHLDPWSIPVIILAGWGWSRRRVEEPAYFPLSIALRCLIPVAGPIASFALIGILATFYMFLPLAFFKTAIAINIQIALANLFIPIPPLAVGRALCCFLGRQPGLRSAAESAGTVILLGLVVLDHTLQWSLFAEWVMRPSAVVLKWVLHQ